MLATHSTSVLNRLSRGVARRHLRERAPHGRRVPDVVRVADTPDAEHVQL